MATEGASPIRRAILLDLEADEALTAIVPATSIQPLAANPPWPFIRCGAISAVPIDAACVDGDNFDVTIHSFAKPRLNGSGQMVETAEDFADRIGTAVVRRLNRRRLTLESGVGAKVRRTGHQLLQDGAEADAFHHIATFRVRVIS